MGKTTSTDAIKFTDDFVISENVVLFTRTATNGNTVSFRKEYCLTSITIEELLVERLSGKPGLVFKNGSSLYFTAIPEKMKFFACSNLGTHLCPDCGHMSALPDSQGGCRKVRDRSMTSLDIRNSYNKKQSVTGSKRIEKYDFIELGYESFNTTQDSLLVLKCQNRIDIIPHPKPSASEAKALKESLATFLEEDFD